MNYHFLILMLFSLSQRKKTSLKYVGIHMLRISNIYVSHSFSSNSKLEHDKLPCFFSNSCGVSDPQTHDLKHIG
ncbi:hypothetical protein MtrunA17_Chr1g0149731 [Medicago truncatula]|uniref:Uncharacterized protein n=1 Tax=Medicago truncatula TaxID=3880 RepID=A0A396JIJ4_MEDTR|nr:hypothetical protein MtrunA17_Chr1g0149731 [Medicago truncatula]